MVSRTGSLTDRSVFCDTHCSPWERPCFTPKRCFISPLFLCIHFSHRSFFGKIRKTGKSRRKTLPRCSWVTRAFPSKSRKRWSKEWRTVFKTTPPRYSTRFLPMLKSGVNTSIKKNDYLKINNIMNRKCKCFDHFSVLNVYSVVHGCTVLYMDVQCCTWMYSSGWKFTRS